jgi:glycogen debranching enzyme
MSTSTAHATPQSPRSTASRHSRYRDNATHSIPRSIADAVVIKDDDVFFLCDPSGDVPLGNVDGLGLYYHDCRFLDGYELRLAGSRLNALASTCEDGFRSVFELTNHEITRPKGAAAIHKQRIGVRWERIVDAGQRSLRDLITVQNFSHEAIACPLSFAFQSAFDDVFTIRGFHPGTIGRAKTPVWKHGGMTLAYAGADGVRRALRIAFDPVPRATGAGAATLEIKLRPGQSHQVRVSLTIAESASAGGVHHASTSRSSAQRVTTGVRRNTQEWLGHYTQVTSDSALLNTVVDRSLRDLRVLRSRLRDKAFFSAGLPWYGTLFGRDSLVAALETLAYEPGIAEDTLRLLASYQGSHVDDWRDEQPGKILHELRRGELAHLNEIPQTPYYGSVDSTPLFLILIGAHAHWTGDLTVFNDLRSHVERALDWIATFGESTRSGYLTYQASSSKGLGNQGWKDSGDAIVNADGSLATAPIALVEVQGYVYLAKLTIADLFERAGEVGTAARLRADARALRVRFNRDFWLHGKGTYALAVQADNAPAAVVSSNPGQALWSGIADADKARKVAGTLMSPDLFSGWGIRTLSVRERRYNPIGYHVGTVWPHDNAIIAAGLRRYGFDEAAGRVLGAMLQAAEHFEHHRLPETFCGFSRDEFGRPVRYPVACHPQAWAAGAVPFMLERLLGLTARAFDQQLRITRPVLPDGVNVIELRQLRIGGASVSLRFARLPRGHIGVDVLDQDGDLRVEVEPEAKRGAA